MINSRSSGRVSPLAGFDELVSANAEKEDGCCWIRSHRNSFSIFLDTALPFANMLTSINEMNCSAVSSPSNCWMDRSRTVCVVVSFGETEFVSWRHRLNKQFSLQLHDSYRTLRDWIDASLFLVFDYLVTAANLFRLIFHDLCLVTAHASRAPPRFA